MNAILLDFLVALSGLVVGYLAHVLKPPKKKKKAKPDPGPSSWVVWVGTATVYRADYVGYGFGNEQSPVQGEVAVRLRRRDEKQPYGIVKVADEDFETKLRALVREAEERCTVLNAVYDEVGV